MQKAKVINGANADGTANDNTVYVPESWNDNMGNLFKLVENAGYTLIDDDGTSNSLGLQQVTKAVQGLYNPAFTYNTSSIVTQTIDDIVTGSDGKRYKVLNNNVVGDDPVGSITGNWEYYNPNASGGEISITGTATFTNSTQNINLTGIGLLDLDIGDVLKVSGSISNNTEFTLESIVNDDNIIVNYEHRGQLRTDAEKSLIDEVSTTNVTIILLAKYYNASWGLGQGWVTPTSARVPNDTYTNSTNRTIDIAITGYTAGTNTHSFQVQGKRIAYQNQSSTVGASGINFRGEALKGNGYILETIAGTILDLVWQELR